MDATSFDAGSVDAFVDLSVPAAFFLRGVEIEFLRGVAVDLRGVASFDPASSLLFMNGLLDELDAPAALLLPAIALLAAPHPESSRLVSPILDVGS